MYVYFDGGTVILSCVQCRASQSVDGSMKK